MTLTLTQHPLAVHGQCMDPTGTLVCRMHETHVLGDDAVEVLRPRRPAFDPPWMLVTVLVAQHRATLLMTPRRLHGRHQGMNALYE